MKLKFLFCGYGGWALRIYDFLNEKFGNNKFKSDYPSWSITKDLDYIFNEIIEYYIQTFKLNISLKNKGYFKRLRI